MTLSEFKAWFEGYIEDMDGPPSAKQWKKVKARVKEIDGTTITEHVYFHRYWPGHPPNYWSGPLLVGGTGVDVGPNTITLSSCTQDASPETFDSNDAMFALGKSDADEGWGGLTGGPDGGGGLSG